MTGLLSQRSLFAGTPWRWRTLLSVDVVDWYLQHGIDEAQERILSELNATAVRLIDVIGRDRNAPTEGNLVAVRWLPMHVEYFNATAAWPSASPMYAPTACLLVARVSGDEMVAELGRYITRPKLTLGPVSSCTRSPFSEMAGFRLKAARAFLLHVFGTGIAPGHWMVENAGVVMPGGVAECDSILHVLERERLITRGEYSPDWTCVRAPLNGGATGYNVFRRDGDAAFKSYLEGQDCHYGHYLWHPVRENESRARELYEAAA